MPATGASAVRRERQEIAARILAALSARDREVLIRFYLHGHPAERILADLGITETQFRRIKSRAKASFAAHIQKAHIQKRVVPRSRAAKRT